MIRIEEIHRLFDLWIDKVGSEYLSSSEKDDFINSGVREFLGKFFSMGNGHAFGSSRMDAKSISELVKTGTHTVVGGEVSLSDFESSQEREVYHVVRVEVSTGDTCGDKGTLAKYVEQNSVDSQRVNDFKKPDSNNYIYYIQGDDLIVEPIEEGSVRVVYIANPLRYTLDEVDGLRGPNAVDLEFKDADLNEILSLSLKHAGISTREVELIQSSQSVELNN